MSANFFKIYNGINVPSVTADPSSPVAGDMVYRSDTGKFRQYVNGAWRDMVSADDTQTLTNKTLTGNTAANLISGSGTLTLNTTGIATVPNATDTLVGKATTDTLSNKTLDNTTVESIKAANFTIQDGSDTTKQAQFVASGITTGTTRSYTLPDASTTIVGTGTTQTLTNKTLDNTSTVTLKDTNFTIQDDGDVTRQAKFQASAITTGTTRTITIPDASTTIVGTDATQTLTAKTFGDAPTFTQISTPSNPSSGFNKIYPKSDGNFYNLTSAGVESQIGGGSGGAKNYLGTVNNVNGNGNFELGSTTGWSLGTTGTITNGIPTGSPTFGSGASGNLSISAVTSGKLAGSYSLSYASSAATTAGNMLASQAFTLDTEDQAKVLTWKFYYSPTVGPTTANWSGTSSNSFGVAVYDVTNSVWLGTAGQFSMTQSSGVGYSTGTFQTGATTASVRFVVYNAAATSGAITVLFDDFSVSPQTAPMGPAVTDWVSYTPTLSGIAVGNGTQAAAWRRVGDSIELSYSLSTGTTSTYTSQFKFSLPTGLTIDTTKFANGSTADTVLGNAFALVTASANAYGGQVIINSSTQLSIRSEGGVTANRDWSNTGPATWTASTAGQEISFIATVPVSGWSSNTVMSNDTDTRVVAAAIGGNPSNALGTGSTTVNYPTVSNDTHGAYSGGVYTVPVSGFYQVTATAVATGTLTSGSSFFQLTTNIGSQSFGNLKYAAGTNEIEVTTTGVGFATAGQTIFIQGTEGGITAPTYGSTFRNRLSINRLSGPAVIAATETVACKYHNIAGTSVSNSFATVPFATKIYDTHNAFNGATGVFTAPVSGKYRITTNIYVTGATYTTSQEIAINFLITSTPEGLSATQQGMSELFGNGGTHALTSLASKTYQLNAGDTLAVQFYSDVANTLSSAAGRNYICIERIGN